MASALSERVKVVTALNYAAGTASRNGAILDTAGWGGVLVGVHLATIASSSVASVKLQQDTAAAMGSAADLLGTSISVVDDDDNQIVLLDLFQPRERYIRVVVVKDGSNSCAESAWYMLYNPKEAPNTLSVTDLVTAEQHNSPAEGTA